ncbi:MAG: YgfZ/GcvT domain-containing protein, partial [Burkholderiaceae bacterium]
MSEAGEPIALGRFGAPQDELLAALNSPVVARLPELGVIAVEGADAVTFLQSQLTNDVAALSEGDFQLNGYCTPKGRLLATFHQWRVGPTILLQLPRELLAPVRKRLAMFVLRSKATLVDVSDAWNTFAMVGKGAAQSLQGAGFEIPAAPWTSVATAGGRLHRLPGA